MVTRQPKLQALTFRLKRTYPARHPSFKRLKHARIKSRKVENIPSNSLDEFDDDSTEINGDDNDVL